MARKQATEERIRNANTKPASRHTCIIINHIKKKKTVIEVKKEKTKHSGAYELELKNEGVNELRGATEAE